MHLRNLLLFSFVLLIIPLFGNSAINVLESGISWVDKKVFNRTIENFELNSAVIFTTAYDEYALEAFKLNSIGSTECRNEFRHALKDFLQPNLDNLSETSRKRFDSNPLRILDTKIDFELAGANSKETLQAVCKKNQIHAT